MRARSTVIIPTLNEIATIGGIVREFKRLGFPNVLVIDGHSVDGTVEDADAAGAEVVLQDDKGKGAAIRQAFELVDTDYCVMIDGDGTYSPYEVFKLLNAVRSKADHVVGTRLCARGAISKLHRIGNYGLNLAFWLRHDIHVTDICSGYRAFTKDCYKSFDLRADGFEVEAEMTLQTIQNGFSFCEEYVTYVRRYDGSSPKLKSFADGYRILRAVLSMPEVENTKRL